jgi:hypothetical protein
MDSNTLSTIASRYPWASWAVWDDAFPDGDCVEEQPERLVDFVMSRRTELTTDVVLLGLNRADDLPAPFSNFHAPTRKHYDYRLKEFIQDGDLHRLHGAYMTDLVDEVDPDSKQVTVTEEDAAVLLEQLRLLGVDSYHAVCFGNKPFDALVRYFDADVAPTSPEMKHATVAVEGFTLDLYRVWFYGLYGALQDKVPVFEKQLQELNQHID